MNWQQGEHVTLIGPTGAGKSTLINAILDKRDYVVFFRTKRDDSTLDELRADGYLTARTVEEINVELSRFWVLAPTYPPRKGVPSNQYIRKLKDKFSSVFAEAFMKLHEEGRWTIVVDEARIIADFLGLSDEYVWLLTQGRSHKNSVVSGTQRPRHIPLEAYDQPVHLFFFRDSDTSNVRRVAEMAGINAEMIMRTVPNLREHYVLYVNTRSGKMVQTTVKV